MIIHTRDSLVVDGSGFRILRDSIDPAVLQQFPADLVGGYVDGIFGPVHAQLNEPGWDAASWDLFNVPKVRIAVKPDTNDGNVGDDEQFDMTNGGLVGWVVMRRQAGIDSTGYTSWSNWAAARDAFIAAGVPEPWWWIAFYSVPPQIFTRDNLGRDVGGRCVAHQYANGAMTGHNYDESIVVPFWPGVDMTVGLDPTDITVKAILDRVSELAYAIVENSNPAPNQGELLALARSDHDSIARLTLPWEGTVTAELDAIKTSIANITGASGGLTAAQQAELDALKAAVDRIETAMKGA